MLPDWQLPAVALYAVTPHRVQAARTAAVLRILQESFAGRWRLPEKYVEVQISADYLRGHVVARLNGEACSEEAARMVAELLGCWRK